VAVLQPRAAGPWRAARLATRTAAACRAAPWGKGGDLARSCFAKLRARLEKAAR
jgi:hypothetical protein